MIASRESVRDQLRVYMSRTGWSAREIADRAGYSRQTLVQFMSGARFGNREGIGQETAGKLAEFIRLNPAPLPEVPGTLYETEATREMDRMLEHAAAGGWGKIYGPAGAQKTFLLEYRAAESARRSLSEAGGTACDLVLVGADPDMTPRALLARIAQGLAAPYAYHTDALRDSVLSSVRRRRHPLAVVIDEAQLLYNRVDTLETLRRLGDKARGRMGILVAGNEQVVNLFDPRQRNYFEQWRSRVEQDEARVLGPTMAEARKILLAEFPGLVRAAADEIITSCRVGDPVTKREYVNARRLFNSLRNMQRAANRKMN